MTTHHATGNRRRRLTARRLVVVCGLGAAIVGGIWIVRSGRSSAASGGGSVVLASAGSDRASVRTMAFEITTTVNGELEARNSIEIRSKLESSSTIVELAPEGKSVKAGELLVRLNTDKLEADLVEQTLQVESARADLVAAENGYNIQLNENESKLRQAQLKLDLALLAKEQWTKGEVEKKRQETELALEKAQRDLARLTDKFANSEKLFKMGFLSKDERDRDEIAKIEADAALKKAVLEKSIYWEYQHPEDEKKKTSDVTEAQSELDRVKMNNEIELASKEAMRTNRRRQLAVREDKLKRVQTQLDAATMRAPSDGLIVYSTSMERNMWGGNEGPLQIGRQVSPNELIMVLPDTSEMMASVRVQESMAGRVKQGQVATIKVDAAGGRVCVGQVESIGVLAEGGGWRDPNRREYTVKIALDKSTVQGLKPSMRVEGQIILGQVEDAPAVPVQAIFTEGAVRFVYTAAGQKFVKTPVKLGRRSDTYAEIAAGANVGDIVLVREPAPSEVFTRAWDPEQLTLAGYKLNDDGQPVLIGADPDRPGRGGPGGSGGQGGPGGGRGRVGAAGKAGAGADAKVASGEPSKGATAKTPTATGESASAPVAQNGTETAKPAERPATDAAKPASDSKQR